MRRFALAIIFFLAFAAPAEAQTEGSIGFVAAELERTRVEVIRDEPQTVHGWFNATITCESNYAPRPVLVQADERSLEDEDGEQMWTIEPLSVQLDLIGIGANRYEVKRETDFVVGATELAAGKTGAIDFFLLRTGSGFPSNDCALFGTSWRFEEPPHIDVSSPPAPEQVENSSASNNVAPLSFSPADVIVDQGPVRGESHVPNEAFVSMGSVLVLFSSYGVYEWRRSRKD